ncbi:unnamed protein product, partial [Prorocentrum cordatum]
MAQRALDGAESQACVNFDYDDIFRWHHRLSLVQMSPGVWAVASPDGELLLRDHSGRLVAALGRAAAFPVGLRGQACAFEGHRNEDIEAVDVRGLATAIRATAPAAPPGELDLQVSSDLERLVYRDAAGLALASHWVSSVSELGVSRNAG